MTSLEVPEAYALLFKNNNIIWDQSTDSEYMMRQLTPHIQKSGITSKTTEAEIISKTITPLKNNGITSVKQLREDIEANLIKNFGYKQNENESIYDIINLFNILGVKVILTDPDYIRLIKNYNSIPRQGNSTNRCLRIFVDNGFYEGPLQNSEKLNISFFMTNRPIGVNNVNDINTFFNIVKRKGFYIPGKQSEFIELVGFINDFGKHTRQLVRSHYTYKIRTIIKTLRRYGIMTLSEYSAMLSELNSQITILPTDKPVDMNMFMQKFTEYFNNFKCAEGDTIEGKCNNLHSELSFKIGRPKQNNPNIIRFSIAIRSFLTEFKDKLKIKMHNGIFYNWIVGLINNKKYIANLTNPPIPYQNYQNQNTTPNIQAQAFSTMTSHTTKTRDPFTE
jgi:hypothetical protein